MATELIERLKAAESGSRELDAEVALAVGYATDAHIAPGNTWIYRGSAQCEDPPHYTTSLDAALPGEEIVSVRRIVYDGRTMWHAENIGGHMGVAATEPLARRIAALTAREQSQ